MEGSDVARRCGGRPKKAGRRREGGEKAAQRKEVNRGDQREEEITGSVCILFINTQDLIQLKDNGEPNVSSAA
ncbi:hypothetical protein fugu_005374 [Takifugu bimaculatus]|uniref:Uncharacterized protein n=1 Tax=Takifugu bimaculatus TaxID=433685 RepID=A0A4Z2BDC5_9TELE|nr:hypothetical protein fugu_005374 [Takifugu bimaculatus]